MKNVTFRSHLAISVFLVLSAVFLIHAQGTQKLTGHVPHDIARLGMKPIGRLDSLKNLHLSIGLPLRNQETLNVLLHQLYDPTSPTFHHYLTVQQFTQQFGPTDQDYQAVVTFAKANGLRVDETSPNKMILSISGPVHIIEKALHLSMKAYHHPTEVRDFFAPDREPSLDLTVPVLGIEGLSDYALPRPALHSTPIPKGETVSSNSGSGPGGGYMGYDYRAAYLPDVTLTGSGQSVGLVEFAGYYAGDITYYESIAGLPNVPLQNVLVAGFDGHIVDYVTQKEVSMDIENVISIAPGLSQVIVYETSNQSSHWHDILNRMATDNLAKQLSCSWITSLSSDPVGEQIFMEMAAQGQTFFGASGDYDAYTGSIGYPADSPNITVVGGTTLTTTEPGGSYVSETVWNTGHGGGSGGGVSTNYSLPSWQYGIATPSNQGSNTMRNIPDLSLIANNVYVRVRSSDEIAIGTSCAAPLWAGIIALVNQQCQAGGGTPVGFINPNIYAIGLNSSKYSAALYDITTGNNESSSSPTKFSAVVGYDLCSGWGTPKGQALIDRLTIFSVSLTTPSFVEGGSGGAYEVNGVNKGTNWSGTIYHGQTIKANPPSGFVFASWSDGSTYNPRTLGYDFSGYAFFKGIHLSNNASAFANNGQRKFVQTPDGWMHMVYESAIGGTSHVFYENRDPQTGTWQIVQMPGPTRFYIDDGSGGKSPSIDYNENAVMIVFQRSDGNIDTRVFVSNGSSYGISQSTYPYIVTNESYGNAINPNISWHGSQKFLILWEGKSSAGIHYASGIYNTCCGTVSVNSNGFVPFSTNANSINATISTHKPSSDADFDVAYEQSDSAKINYCWVRIKSDWGIEFCSGPRVFQQIAVYTSPRETNPSIVSTVNGPLISWSGTELIRNRFHWNCIDTYSPASYVYNQYLDLNRITTSTNVAGNTAITGYGYGNAYQFFYFDAGGNVHWVSVSSPALSGGVQLGNGSSLSSTYATGYHSSTQPYYFETTNSLSSYGLQKTSAANEELTASRGCIVTIDTVRFCYLFGNIRVDGKSIGFTTQQDTTKFNNLENINKVLISEAFEVSNKTNLSFIERMNVTDSIAAPLALRDSGYVSCKAELIDATTIKVIGKLRDSKMNSAHPYGNGDGSYLVGTKGLGQKSVRVRVTIETNVDRAGFMLFNSFEHQSDSTASKLPGTNLSMNVADVPPVYGLGPNYPNPFNPTTQIRYQLPASAHVSLEVYDILGRLVATLVDGTIDAGYHSASFDGSKLSSGVYLVRFVVNPQDGGKPILLTRKLVLMK